MPSAITSTVSVNSSRECVPATWSSTHGMTRVPTIAVNATSAATFERGDEQRHAEAAARLAARRTAIGSITSATTVKRSSTTSQPTAMWPVRVCSALLSASTRISTTVLATDSAMPNTMPLDQLHPKPWTSTRAEHRRDRALRDGARESRRGGPPAAPRRGTAGRRRTSAG